MKKLFNFTFIFKLNTIARRKPFFYFRKFFYIFRIHFILSNIRNYFLQTSQITPKFFLGVQNLRVLIFWQSYSIHIFNISCLELHFKTKITNPIFSKFPGALPQSFVRHLFLTKYSCYFLGKNQQQAIRLFQTKLNDH